MKLKSLGVIAGCLLSLSATASNEHTFEWYASSTGNNLVITTTIGCINNTVMYENHAVRVNSWDGFWSMDDFDYRFILFGAGGYSDLNHMNSLNTSSLHDVDGNIFPSPHILYQTRQYEVIAGKAGKVGDLNLPGWTVGYGYFPIDVKCNTIPKKIKLVPYPTLPPYPEPIEPIY